MRSKNSDKEQPNNPLHGIKLAEILQYLISTYGWEELGVLIKINCFKSNPTIKSCLKFLRKTPWARTKVENLYLKSIRK
ncbi:VF530 family protein [Lutibacter sp.]|uniref:VF530 family protein n=1 Tax=Lutibacter sp. TaxID=1925666 RepID=UPI0025B849C1|nr:VF530 family protein [Lutibacter sp.]MCF6166973.1 VF530 family protein [Lutibacter sp.]